METLKKLFQISYQKTLESDPEEPGKQPVFNPPSEAVSKKVLKALQQEHEEKLRKYNEIVQRNYHREIKNSPIASLEGFMVYLEIHEDHGSIFEDIIRHQNRKLLPMRMLIQRKFLGLLNLTSKKNSVKFIRKTKTQKMASLKMFRALQAFENLLLKNQAAIQIKKMLQRLICRAKSLYRGKKIYPRIIFNMIKGSKST